MRQIVRNIQTHVSILEIHRIEVLYMTHVRMTLKCYIKRQIVCYTLDEINVREYKTILVICFVMFVCIYMYLQNILYP